jgi:hypothetical protein
MTLTDELFVLVQIITQDQRIKSREFQEAGWTGDMYLHLMG